MYLKKKKKEKKLNKKSIIFTSDFETYLYKNEHIVYGIGLYTNKKYYKDFFINKEINNNKNDYILSIELLKEFIDYLLTYTKNNNIYVYFHNLRRFDGVFILKVINDYKKKYKIDILIKNNIIYKIVIGNITFLDLKNIINKSLNELSKQFLNKEKNNYKIYKIKSYKDVLKDYGKISKYLYTDVSLLYQLVNVIREKIWTKFNLDITKHITISNLSFSYYRSIYYKEDYKVEITKNYKYSFIEKSYLGGICSVVKPYLKNGYYYDINSLYPFIMKEQYFPSGKGVYIYNINNIKDIDTYFGFIECLIYVPNKYTIGPLSIKIKNRLIQPWGYLRGVWFSEEIKFAIQCGCTIKKIFKILHYKNKKKMFSTFVNDLYSERVKTKSVILKEFYKLFMNSLYGRLGINNTKTATICIEDNDLLYYEVICELTRISNTNWYFCVLNYENAFTFFKTIKKDNLGWSSKDIEKVYQIFKKLDMKHNKGYSCIQIASAITSYARIRLLSDIYTFKKNNIDVVYYDTDSVFVNKPINKDLINNNIGYYKLENIIKDCYFLAPKLYSYSKESDETTGKKIIKFKGISYNEKELLGLVINWKELLTKDTKGLTVYVKKLRSNLKKLTVTNMNSINKYDLTSSKYDKTFDDDNIWVDNKLIYLDMR